MPYLLFIIAKSATTAMLLTTFVPGGGQFYTKRYTKGIIIGGAQAYLIYSGIQTQIDLNEINRTTDLATEQQNYKDDLLEQRREIAWWMALVWTIGVFDAYVDAQLYNFESDLSLDKTGRPRVELSLKINY